MNIEKLLEIVSRIAGDDAPTAEELTQARTGLVEALKVATAAESRDLEAAVAIRGAIDAIDTEVKARADEEARVEAEAAKLLEGLETEDESENEDEPESESEDEPVAEDEKLPVAASLRTALRRTSARMQADAEPEGPKHARIMTLGAAQSEQLVQTATMDDVAKVFDRAAGRVKSRGDRQSLVRIETDYPEDRRLFGTERADNDRILDALFQPVVASGGVCDPLPADFTHPTIGDRGRPIRDALARFQANRGGVRFSPTATIADLTGAVGVWTHADDVAATGEKDCLVLTCEPEETAYVDAVTACLKVGNFQARFNPEFWRSRLDLLMVAHDRIAEQKIVATIDAGSTQVTYGTGNGTIYAVLSAVDKAVAGIRSRNRYRGTIRVILPDWVHQALRSDIASQKLGSSPAEALTIADTVINSFFSARGVVPTYSLDIDVFGVQGAGALVDFPGANVEFYVFPEGAWFFMDGGTLDLGTEIVDSELIKTNDRQAFMETFEQTVHRGGESLAITVPVDELCVCPTTP